MASLRRAIERFRAHAPQIADVLTILVFLISSLSFGAGLLVGLSKADACPHPAAVIWDNGNQGHNGYASATLSVHLEACSTLMVTSGHLVGPDKNECGYQGDQMCVVIFRATVAQDVAVTRLDAGNTWYGVTKSPGAQALADKRAQFFAPPNCSGNGCAFATVLKYVDSSADPPEVIRP